MWASFNEIGWLEIAAQLTVAFLLQNIMLVYFRHLLQQRLSNAKINWLFKSLMPPKTLLKNLKRLNSKTKVDQAWYLHLLYGRVSQRLGTTKFANLIG